MRNEHCMYFLTFHKQKLILSIINFLPIIVAIMMLVIGTIGGMIILLISIVTVIRFVLK